VLLLWCAVAHAAQTLYKYRDADGNWVYTDKRPAAVTEFEEQQLAGRASGPAVTVRSDESAGGATTVIVTNEYVAPVEILLELTERDGVAPDVPNELRTVVPAASETRVLQVRPRQSGASWSFGYRFQYMPGDPQATHSPPVPYRAPFAPATSFAVSQAYPSEFSHADAANRFAVDFDMPVGTPVYAARGGTVMDIATHFFKSGTDPADGTRANLVRILHDDGTMAIYAHLNRDSIRVEPGSVVERGQYIADSGNTGFTTGPHLHFVVQHNAGLALESVPVEFAGRNGEAVSVRTGQRLTAH
jgi:murein DD-endopeptidase MepM/ murein hydrolase activator NlpD